MSRKSHLAGFSSAKSVRESTSSLLRVRRSSATGAGSANSGVENQLRIVRCRPNYVFCQAAEKVRDFVPCIGSFKGYASGVTERRA